MAQLTATEKQKILEALGLHRIESEAWNSIEIDANFCFREILLFMVKAGFYCSFFYESKCYAHFYNVVEALEVGFHRTFFDGEGPNIETAIAQTFLNFIHSIKA